MLGNWKEHRIKSTSATSDSMRMIDWAARMHPFSVGGMNKGHQNRAKHRSTQNEVFASKQETPLNCNAERA
jgi:hypothetical protein